MIEDTVDRLRTEATRIRLAALPAAERHYAAESPWYYTVYWLGVPSSILAAVAGATAFSELKYSGAIAGGISIVVAVLSALSTFLDPAKKAAAHHLAAKGYEALYHNAGFFCRIEALDDSIQLGNRTKLLSALKDKLNELGAASPPIPGRAAKRAQLNIERGWGEVVRDPQEIARSDA